MVGIVRKLKKLCKEEQALFEKAVNAKGLEVCCSRTVVHFSQGERCQWLQQLYSSYRANIEEKCKVLNELRYTGESVGRTSKIWSENPRDVHGKISF